MKSFNEGLWKSDFNRIRIPDFLNIFILLQEMRHKVGNMMKLLAERKNKLKSTENVIEKKGVVVEKVTKLLDSKQRKETFVSNKKEELLAFDKAGKK